MDKMGIIRCGSRLRRQDLPTNQKLPIFVVKHWIFWKILEHEHNCSEHLMGLPMEAYIKRKFDGDGLINMIKVIVAKCPTCQAINAQPTPQLIGPLRKFTLDGYTTFEQIAIDVAGPWEIARQAKSTRKNPICDKIWVLVAICVQTKAVIFEPLDSLDTDAIVNCLAKIMYDRGAVKVIYSDNYSSFKTAEKAIKESVFLDYCPVKVKWSEVHLEMLDRVFDWKYNAAFDPAGNGLAEAAVKMLKNALKVLSFTTITIASMSKTRKNITRPEFVTLLAKCAHRVNSRPLCKMVDENGQQIYLYPNMMIMGNGNFSLARRVTEGDTLVQRFTEMKRIYEEFTQKWFDYMLTHVRSHPRWTQAVSNLKKGQVVVLVSKGDKREYWPLATVVQIQKDFDGLARKVLVRHNETGNDTWRNMRQLVPLDFYDESRIEHVDV